MSDRFAVSTRWEKSSEFKLPFIYLIGVGPVTEEVADDRENWPESARQLCEVHRLDMGDLIKLGIAEELDFMSKALIADDAKKDAEAAREAVDRAIMKADNYERMETMVNLVVAAGVLQPKLSQPPLVTETEGDKTVTKVNENARQKGLLYVDHIPWNDRLELFSVIFETEGLSDFREEQEPSVADVEHEPGVQLPSDGPVDIRSDDPERVLL